MSFGNGNTAEYAYNAAGERLSTSYGNLTSGVTFYNSANYFYTYGAISNILIDGGYITLSGSTPIYHYYLKDHLGSNRVVCNASGSVEQVNHYYPFGGLFGESTNASTQKYKYNGKELDRVHGLNWYDYGARFMDGMRFTTIDPMAEKYYDVSPYAYCANNPVNAIDMNGDTISYYYDGTRYVYKMNRNESGFYNKDGYPLDRPFVNALSKSLKSIQEGKTGNELLDYLISSITEININMGDDNETKYINGHVIVNWNPDDDQGAGVDEYGGYRSPSYITLAHELFHAKDYAQFKSTNKKIWYASHSGKITRENELLTCISENRIRAEHGLPLRRYYASYRHSKTGYNPSLIPIYSVLPISVWGKSK